MIHKLLRTVLILVCAISVCTKPLAYAQDAFAAEAVFQEYQLKAAFLLNFAKFIDWPYTAFPNDKAPLVIGVVGKDPFGSTLDKIAKNQIIQERKVVVKKFRQIHDVKICQILFIDKSEEESLSAILDFLKGKNILTVSDMEHFAANGGMIQFIKQDNKIRFEINTDAALRKDLKISSKLLNLAQITKAVSSQAG